MRPVSSGSNYNLTDDAFRVFLDGLDPSLVDAVLGGHTHNLVHQFTSSGIPIIVSEKFGYYLNALHLDYDPSLRKVVNAQIEGPIPICSKVFSKRMICDVPFDDTREWTNGPLVEYSLYGESIKPVP